MPGLLSHLIWRDFRYVISDAASLCATELLPECALQSCSHFVGRNTMTLFPKQLECYRTTEDVMPPLEPEPERRCFNAQSVWKCTIRHSGTCFNCFWSGVFVVQWDQVKNSRPCVLVQNLTKKNKESKKGWIHLRLVEIQIAYLSHGRSQAVFL